MGCPTAAQIFASVSPIHAFRRCPTCAALLGLTLVCSIKTFSRRASGTSLPRPSMSVRRAAPRSRRALRNPGPAMLHDNTPATAVASRRSTSCCASSRGLRPSFLDSCRAMAHARSPTSGRGGSSTTGSSICSPVTSATATRIASATRDLNICSKLSLSRCAERWLLSAVTTAATPPPRPASVLSQ